MLLISSDSSSMTSFMKLSLSSVLCLGKVKKIGVSFVNKDARGIF